MLLSHKHATLNIQKAMDTSSQPPISFLQSRRMASHFQRAFQWLWPAASVFSVTFLKHLQIASIFFFQSISDYKGAGRESQISEKWYPPGTALSLLSTQTNRDNCTQAWEVSLQNHLIYQNKVCNGGWRDHTKLRNGKADTMSMQRNRNSTVSNVCYQLTVPGLWKWHMSKL